MKEGTPTALPNLESEGLDKAVREKIDEINQILKGIDETNIGRGKSLFSHNPEVDISNLESYIRLKETPFWKTVLERARQKISDNNFGAIPVWAALGIALAGLTSHTKLGIATGVLFIIAEVLEKTHEAYSQEKFHREGIIDNAGHLTEQVNLEERYQK